jgi:predicted nucleic acid-binding protein
MATTDAEPLFIDTNILIYANNRASNLCEPARKKLDELTGKGNSLVISYQVLREYLVIMTRPGFFEKPVSVKTAVEDVTRMKKEFVLLFSDDNSLDKLTDLLRKYDIKGKRIHDAAIVSLMLANGITDLLTHNTDDFKSFQEITLHSI